MEVAFEVVTRTRRVYKVIDSRTPNRASGWQQ
jgi:hypothetical protein